VNRSRTQTGHFSQLNITHIWEST